MSSAKSLGNIRSGWKVNTWNCRVAERGLECNPRFRQYAAERLRMENSDPNDPVSVYLREIGTLKPLANDEETKLFRELAGPGDWDEARENVARRLIEAHLAQVVNIAQKHAASGVPMLDLIEEGNKGLMNAVRGFAERPIGDFTDYAATCIDDAIKKGFG